MRTVLEPLPFVWRPLIVPGAACRLQDILDSWLHTPYMLGQKTKQKGVDCVHFLTAVLDEMYGFERQPIQKLGGDRCLHDPESTRSAMRQILEIYFPNERVLDMVIEPGDIAVTGPKGGGPGHAMVVSNRPKVLYHATRHGVQTMGNTYNPETQLFFKVYRPLDKHLWQC